MTDITEKLRGLEVFFMDGGISPVGFEAAGEIDRLRAEIERLRAGGCARDQNTTQYCAEASRLTAENERLRKALHPFSEAAGKFDPDEGDGKQHVWGWSPTIEMLRKARAALQDKRDDPGEGKAAIEGAAD